MRLLIVDDHEVVRRGVRSLLADHNGWDVCGEAVDGEDALEKARELKPDLIVMDVSMPRLNGLEATRQVRGILPNCEVLVLSQHENSEMARQALRAGARGYVSKSSISKDLISAVAKAFRHEYFFDPAILDQTPTAHTDVQEILQRSAAFEKALRESEERVRKLAEYQFAVMNNMAVGLYVLDANGLVTSINPAGEAILGWTQGELLGKKMHDVTHYKHPDGTPFPASECPELKVRHEGMVLREHEDYFIRKDGGFVPVVFSASPLRDDEKITGVIVSFRDDTEQRRAREALRESHDALRKSDKATALLAAIVASSDDAIISKNLDGIITSWNKSAERTFGYTAEEAIGQHITLIIPVDRLAEEEDIISGLRRGEKIDHFQTVRQRKDGVLIDVSLTISPVQDSSGRVIGASKVARDITVQKRTAEKMRIADESLRLMRVQDEERRRIAREFHDSAGQTLTVLGLSLARLIQNAEVIAPELAKEGKEIGEVVQQLHREIRTTSYLLHPPLLDEAGLNSALSWYVQGVVERSGMAIDLSIAEDFGRLPADMELAIFRVVQECLTNIHRHAESKTAHIRVARENGSVCIEVRDEGKGISPERLTEIQSRGSGVGIAGIRERLRQFRGDMKIESNNSGTRLVARIPTDDRVTAPQIEPLQAAV